MYKGINQYHVVMEVDPQFQQSPDALKNIYVRSTTGKLVPLSAFTHYEPSTTSLAVAHQGQFPADHLLLQPGARTSLWETRSTPIQEVERTIGHAGHAFMPAFRAPRRPFRTRWPPSPT